MNQVNKTLYIPLYGKALVSRRGLLLQDPKAEEIWAAEGFPLKGKSRSKWLAYYMAMRAKVFDRWADAQIAQTPNTVVLHLGCGMDSRALRVGRVDVSWFDVDFPEVIRERKRYFEETDRYHMIGADLRSTGWLEQIPKDRPVLILLEGVSMYLPREELMAALAQWKVRFPEMRILMDCYTEFAAKASKFRNPVREVGVTRVYGLDDPLALTEGTGLTFVTQHNMTPEDLIRQLPSGEQRIFRKLYAGSLSKKLYRLYEYR